MQDTQYKNVNTVIRVYETKLLTPEDFEKMLRASNLAQALDVLKGSEYFFDENEILKTKDFDQFLLTRLRNVYQDLYEITPDSEVVQMFTLRYSYHNAKVLLKQRFKDLDLEHLLIPIGKYSLTTVRNLVKTEQSDILNPVLIEAVQEAVKYYETFGQIEAVDVFMDTYYYKHVRAISERLNNPTITKITDTLIDLDNLSNLVRSIKQEKSRSYLHSVLSSSGSISKQDLIDAADQESPAAIKELYLSQPYADQLESILGDSKDKIDAMLLDKKIDQILQGLMEEGKYQAFGPMPLVTFMFAIEREVTNIRLILVGKDNQIDEEAIRERMRPIYGS